MRTKLKSSLFTLLQALIITCLGGLALAQQQLHIPAKQSNKAFFVENKGQFALMGKGVKQQVDYYVKNGQFEQFFGKEGITYRASKAKGKIEIIDPVNQKARTLPERFDHSDVSIHWVGANTQAQIQKSTQLTGEQVYLFEQENGQSQRVDQIYTFADITYQQIYSGIDVHYYFKNGELKYDFLVDAGADYKQIRIRYDGASLLKQDNGDIWIITDNGTIVEQKPEVFQGNATLPAEWVLEGNDLLLNISGVNSSQPLKIDPLVYYWTRVVDVSDYSKDNDHCAAVKTDPWNNLYVLNNQDVTIDGAAFFRIEKYSDDGSNLGTIFNYSSSAFNKWYAHDLAVDHLGNLYITGRINYTGIVTGQATNVNPSDAFLMKLNASGNAQWTKYFGGNGSQCELQGSFRNKKWVCDYHGEEVGRSVAVDGDGNVYICGNTSSKTGIAQGSNPYKNSIGGKVDGFLAKYNPSGVLQWATYAGGNTDNDYLYTVAAHGQGSNVEVAISGHTNTTEKLGTPPLAEWPNAGNNGFTIKFDGAGNSIWFRYHGGSGSDAIWGSVFDEYGNLYLTGSTNSSDFLSTPSNSMTGFNAFVTKLKPDGTVAWHNLIGGTGEDNGHNLDYEPISKEIIVVGNTTSENNMVFGDNMMQNTRNHNGDYFLARICENGSRKWSTYFGTDGNEQEYAGDVDFGANGIIYFGGTTAIWSNFSGTDYPMPPNSYPNQTNNVHINGGRFPFITAIRDLALPGCGGGPERPEIFDPGNAYTFEEECEDCLPGMNLSAPRYVLTTWVYSPSESTAETYIKPKIVVRTGTGPSQQEVEFLPKGQIIDGWQRIEAEFTPNGKPYLKVDGGIAYFDDLRLHPHDGSMKSYVYDPINLRMMAELDERNYATLYEYDEEGKLVRVKKETEKGIMTIQENRSNLKKTK